MAKIFLYSTMATDIRYVEYGKEPPGGVPPTVRGITIKGGANVANKRFVTPLGVMTELTEEDLAWLQKDAKFVQHVNSGYITFFKRKGDADEIGADMNLTDPSRPLTNADYEEGGRIAKRSPVMGLSKPASVGNT